MTNVRHFVLAIASVACGHTAGSGPTTTLRPACGVAQYWDGGACKSSEVASQKLAAGTAALAKLEIDEAKVALDQVEKSGPLDHATNIGLWEQRGIAAAYTDDEASATRAFDMLLALDPAHRLSYGLSPKATFLFEKTLGAAAAAPALDVNWPRGQKVGEPIPIDVEVLSDPKRFLARATLFVRTRGDASWRAADLTLDKTRHLVLPAIRAEKPVSLEVYLRAYDRQGNEVLTWADPSRPREIALRYEAPTPWYKKWWGITAIVAGGAAIVGTTVYFATLSPPDKIGGDVTTK